MTVHPCIHCHLKADCEVRRAKVASVKGLGLTTIKFRCSIPQQELFPGRVVMARVPYFAVAIDPWEGISTEERILRAIVMGWSPASKVRLFVPYEESDDMPWWLQGNHRDREAGESPIHVISLRASRLAPTDEAVPVCVDCGLPEGCSVPKWVCQLEDVPCRTFRMGGGA